MYCFLKQWLFLEYFKELPREFHRVTPLWERNINLSGILFIEYVVGLTVFVFLVVRLFWIVKYVGDTGERGVVCECLNHVRPSPCIIYIYIYYGLVYFIFHTRYH